MSLQHRLGQFATKNGALRRGMKWLQEHDRETPSGQAAQEYVSQIGLSSSDPETTASQREDALLSIAAQATGRFLQKNLPEQAVQSAGFEDPEPVPRRGRPRRNPPVGSHDVDLSRHSRRCIICKHPERDTIEEAFLQWRRTGDLRLEFKLPNRSSIYRHAHAFGLFDERARNMRSALDFIIEEAETVRPTADSIIRAIRAYSCLDENGRWAEHPRRVIISHETVAAAPPVPVEPTDSEPPGQFVGVEPMPIAELPPSDE